ncbi:MAG: hypothetical protein ACMXYM_02050 [Candidatus Woesearchaeota archaeon]
MDHLLEAVRRFSDAGRAAQRVVPDRSYSLEDHARIIMRRASVTAVDGGSALIARRSNAAIGVVKIASVRYDHPGMDVQVERWVVEVSSDEGYHITMTSLDSGAQRSETFDSQDADGFEREPESGVDLARMLLERDAQSRASGLVFADGSLAPRYPEERVACASLPESVLGIVKRPSHARSSAPESIVSSVGEPVFAHRIDGSWYCRLHPSSARIIRVEGELTDERFETLLVASSDAAVPGYPYVLVLADRFARISNREAKSLALESAARFGLDIGSLHDVLDSLER